MTPFQTLTIVATICIALFGGMGLLALGFGLLVAGNPILGLGVFGVFILWLTAAFCVLERL